MVLAQRIIIASSMLALTSLSACQGADKVAKEDHASYTAWMCAGEVDDGILLYCHKDGGATFEAGEFAQIEPNRPCYRRVRDRFEADEQIQYYGDFFECWDAVDACLNTGDCPDETPSGRLVDYRTQSSSLTGVSNEVSRDDACQPEEDCK